MKKLKSEKGITLVLLVTTLIVLAMITVPIVVNTSNINKVKNYTLFKDDMDVLRESIDIAYRANSDISSIGPRYTGSLNMLNGNQGNTKIINDNDNDVYYVIELKNLNEKLTAKIKNLNYGERNKDINNTSTDVYVINEQSRTIYYLDGILYNDILYYRLQEEFSNVSEAVVPGELVTEFDKCYTDKYGYRAMVPVGYMISTDPQEQLIMDGLVIKDSIGNEFVWIPVGSWKNQNDIEVTNKFDRYAFSIQSTGELDATSNSKKIYNSGISDYYFFEKISDIEKVSVLENGGFYIGRYETGVTQTRTDASGDTDALVKKGLDVYNWVTKDKAEELASNFSKDEKILSKLCSSYVWDTTLKFIEKTGNNSYLTDSNIGNYTNALEKTGATTDVNNIYDLGGNTYEWTLESVSESETVGTVRGGAIGATSASEPATFRKKVQNVEAQDVGFRIALFLIGNIKDTQL